MSGTDSTKINSAISSLTTAVNSNAASIDCIEDAIAIVTNNNTHAAISNGQFVYVKNHGTLAEGLYKATANIAANAALSSSNLTADASGGLNAMKAITNSLSDHIANTPTVYHRCNWLINASNDTVAGNGTASIEVYPNKTFVAHFEAKLNAAGTGTSYSWGINADAFKTTCGLTSMTPVAGGVARFYTSSGAIDTNSQGAGGTFTKNGQFWTPARNYNGTSVGGWDSGHFASGQYISGTVYGTWT